jgi:hypothetical protein
MEIGSSVSSTKITGNTVELETAGHFFALVQVSGVPRSFATAKGRL